MPDSFPMTLDDGTEIEVLLTDATRFGPGDERSGRWADLESEVLAEAFLPHAPGPHVEVTLAGVVLERGQSIRVQGEADRSMSPDGYRGGASSQITAIRAALIGVGPDADEWLDAQVRAKPGEPVADPVAPTPAPVTDLLAMIAVGIAAVIFAVVVVLADLGMLLPRYIAFGLGLQLVASGLYAMRRRRGLPRMFGVGLNDSGLGMSHAGGPAWGALGLTVVALLGTGFGILMMPGEHPFAIYGALWIALVALFLAGHLWAFGRKDAEQLAAIVREAPSEGEGWGRVEGTIRSGGIHRERTHQRHESTTERQYVDTTRTDARGRQEVRTETETNRWYSYDETSNGSVLQVDTPQGRLDVHSRKGIWGTTRSEVLGLTRTERADPGDSIVIVGRRKGGTMQASGPQSLFLFTAPRGALQAARRALRGHRATIVGLVLVALVAGGLGSLDIAADHSLSESSRAR